MSTDPVDHEAQMIGRLAQQFRRPRIEAYLAVVAREVQALEDALQDLLTMRRLDTATGLQLTRIGVKVGQPRNGVTDDDLYRRLVRARIAANRSRGVGEDVLRITRLVVDSTVVVEMEYQQVATVVLRLSGPGVTQTIADILIGFLRRAVVAGVRIILEWSLATDADTFRLAVAGFLSGTHLAGATTLALRAGDAAGFPPSGSAVIEWGTPDEETVTYASRDDDTLYGVSATVNNHPADAVVTALGVTGVGLADADSKLDGALVGAETSVDVDDASEFDASGFIVVDGGLPAEETLEYSSRTGTTFTLVGAVANAHPDDAGVTQGGGRLSGAVV